LLGIGTRRNAAASAIEANAFIVIVADNSSIYVGIADYDGIDPGDRGVVLEPVVIPPSADVAIAIIAVSVVDAAIEANNGRPIAVVPSIVITVVVPAPISGGPEKARLWRKDPGARHPVVTVVTVCPIARSPDVTRLRANRLFVNRQSWRTSSYGYAHRDLGQRSSGEG
jgi:hypothetical protein